MPLFIAFSVQLAAEFMSAAAPRTVLQAAAARQPMSSIALSFKIIFLSPAFEKPENVAVLAERTLAKTARRKTVKRLSPLSTHCGQSAFAPNQRS